MDHLKFQIDINAPREKVWQVLWNDETYRQWTSVFGPGSHAESDWKEGSRVRFLAENGDGMYSDILKLVPGEAMIFNHLGEIKNGVASESAWSGARESYFLSDKNGGTLVDVELDSVGEYKDYFESTFPKALQLVKEIAEK